MCILKGLFIVFVSIVVCWFMSGILAYRLQRIYISELPDTIAGKITARECLQCGFLALLVVLLVLICIYPFKYVDKHGNTQYSFWGKAAMCLEKWID